MLKTYLQLPEGQVLSSGETGKAAIVSVTYTQSVNADQELQPGSVCAGMLEMQLLGDVDITAGQRLKVWRQTEDQVYPLGIFYAEKPTREGSRLKLTAYDPVAQLDKDVTALLTQTTSMQVLSEEVCQACGVTLTGAALPLGQLPVAPITGEGITGRQVLSWIGQLNGRFCRATAEGDVEFSWYQPGSIGIGVSDQKGEASWEAEMLTLSGSVANGTLTLSQGAVEDGILTLFGGEILGYFQGSLSYEDYTVAPIEKVQLRKTNADVGTVFPDGLTGEKNTYILEGNPLLGAVPEESLPEIAEHLFGILRQVTYTPCKVSVPANASLSAGDILQVTDKKGKTVTCYVMRRCQQGQKETLECTGSHLRAATTAVNNRTQADLAGKVLNLRTDLQGVLAELTDTKEKSARLALDLEGIRGQVSRQDGLQEQLSQVEQTAENVKLSLEKLQTEGTEKIKTGMGYTFDDEGLTIHKTGGEILSHLDETGMQVLRGETVMLRADAAGVIATDVKVRNYLIIGSHARLEDYGDRRTACFWLEG